MAALKYFIFIFFLIPASTSAQHGHDKDMPKDTVQMHRMKMDMTGNLSLYLPMQRDGSGTSWLPDNSPMHAYHFMSGNWNFMLHGSLFLRYTNQDFNASGTRGARQFDSPNWLMFMGSRKIGSSSILAFSTMVSLEYWTVTHKGYPLLFQSGEQYEGERLIDIQHPHNFVSTLAVSFSHSFERHESARRLDASGSDIYLYLGYPGEPALGPPVYLHRSSGMNFPSAPLGHHWQDATHITFGVVTAGFRYRNFKIESSIFNGSEPDERKYAFNKPKLNSGSIRLSLNPTSCLALQTSFGYLKEPEELEPGIDQRKYTVSLIHSVSFCRAMLNTSVIWGANQPLGEDLLNSFLVESELDLPIISPSIRIEFVQKPAEDLGLTYFPHDKHVLVNQISIGVAKRILRAGSFDLAIGGVLTGYGVKKDVQSVYGSNPYSAELYLNLRPSSLHGM